ncbi:hypothetical protein psyc5s11_28910 [Clostridium gelidum]|uniref:DUF5666 domain-containing protein n=1 Tax=Clostridium gelidum TaxID=704125 RepID=A0ABM7T676_9CLOT|nr:hypothetical protein [Clostridium gelidum]BCZ46824.1 hypothetical protein psyc5s11_28910 [Clostridium gelidum]
MKIKPFIIIILISLIAFTSSAKAIITSDTYKQGIYNISEIKEFNAIAKLITPDNVSSLIIVDSYGNQKFYKRFDTLNQVINLGSIRDGDLIAIVGTGEIAITLSK